MFFILNLFFVFNIHARLNSVDYKCDEVQELLKDNGTLILSHGNPHLYSKFVAFESKCSISEKPRKAYAISLDKAKCQLGFVCGAKEDLGTYIAPHLIRTCKDGKTTISYETDLSSDRTIAVVKICKNGKWIKK